MNNNKIRKNSVLLLFLAWVIFSSINSAHARPSLNTAATKAEIEAALTGPGITITSGSLTEVAGANGYGTFSDGKVSDGTGPVLGIEQGVFLATTDAEKSPSDVIGPNNEGDISGGKGSSTTDEQLLSIVDNAKYDAVILTLQATPQHDNLNFEFIFGSDEYPEYVCSQFNDAFGFFIKLKDEADSEWKNVAIIPGTQTPIAVNTINSGSCGASADGTASVLTNSALYITNPAGGSNLQYDGFTTLLSVSTNNLIPNQEYDIKLAIADAGDGSYDSGIFLKWLSSTAEVDLDVSLTADNTSPKATVDNVTFTLTANNTGPDAARDVKVAFQLPTGFTWVSDTSNGAYDKQTGIWSLANPLAAQSGTASINIVAKPTTAGVVKAFAQVQSVNATSDPDSTPNNGSQTPPEDDEAQVSLNVQPAPVPQVPNLPTDNCAVNYYGWNITFTGGKSDADHAGTAFADAGWSFNSNHLPERYTSPDSSGTLVNGSLLTELDTSSNSLTGETFLTITRIERKPNTNSFVDMYDADRKEHYIYAVLDSSGNVLTRAPSTGAYVSDNISRPGNPVPNKHTQRINFTTPSDGVAYVYTWIADFEQYMMTPYALCKDHGDAPNSFTDSTHMVGKDLYLGSKPADAELEANFSSDAQGDGSEDDGLKLPAFILGQTSEAVVKVNGTGGYLQAWADWNGNGVFDSAEQVAHNLQDSDANGKIKLTFTVPANATTNTSYLRLRWSTQNNLDATANAKDGEVEDFVIQPVSANAFSCASDIYQYGDNSFRRYNPNNRQYEVISNLHDVSIAYSTKNNLIYGIYKDGSGKVVIIEADGTEKFVGIVHKEDGSVLSDTPIAMAIDANGDAWVRNGDMPATQYYKINLKSLTASEVTLSTTLSAPSPNISDLAYLANGNTNKLYARRDNTLYIIDAKALTLSAKTVTGEGTLGGYGAVWADSNQYVYTYNRANGHLYQISDLSAATPKSKLIIVTDQISSNDAASCSLAPAPFFDLGDAPSQYKKAIHSVDGALSFLGQTIPDVDTSSLASSSALGDDTTGDDEDGATFANLSTSNATYSTSVIATNKNTVDAALIGWIDLDGNGVFDADEAAKVTVPAGSNKTSFTLTWDGLNDTGANTVAGNTYARLRLSTDATLTTTTPDGLVAGGEVEDYALSITSPPAKQVAACTGAWTKSGANYQSTLSNGIKVTASTSVASGGAWSFSPNGNLNTHDAFSNAAVKGNSSLQFVYTWDTTPENSVASATDIAAGQLSFSFSRPVFDPIMHIDRVGGFGNNIPNSALLTLSTANTSLSKLSGFSHLLVNSNTIQRELSSTTLQAGATSESGSDPLLYTAAGSVKIKGNKLNQISFEMSAVGVEGAGADGIEVVLCVDNELDFGDAPSNYGEASHYIEAPNMPYLGNTKPDFEATAAHNMTASGDNSQGNNDEDGTSTLATINTASSRFSLDVIANNPHTTDAYLAAWIDFDGNGTFDADELKQVTVPAGTQNATLTVTWNKLPSDIKAGASFLRLRITTDPDFANNPSATAIASDGESEDYALTIGAGTQTVSGRLFTDSDVDGVYDTGERGMKKVLVAIMGRANDGQGVCIGTLSKADGSFSFKDIKPGNYQVYETGTPSSTCDSSLAGTPDGFIATTAMLQTISVSNAAVTDVNFGQVYDASHQISGEFTSFRKDEQSRITAGEKALYAHTFIAPSKGSVNFSAQLQGNNWGYLLHHDANCDRQLSSAEYQATLTPITVNAQDQVCIVATVGSPIRAVTGEQGVLTITADFTYANTLSATTKTATVTDITTIQQGTEKQGAPLSNNDQRRLVLTKTVRNITAGTPASETLNQAAPGDVLEYRIHYYNQTAKDIDHLNIDDGIPEFTSLVNGSMTCQTDKPSSLNCHEVMQGDFLQWQFSGVLKSGHKGSVSFRVSID